MFFSAYTYLSLAAYFEDLELNGFAQWMKIQYHEELMHAEKIYAFVNDRDGRVRLQALAAAQIEWDSPLDAFKFALAGRDHATHLGREVQIQCLEVSEVS